VNDELPTRASGPWATDKLYYVGRYLNAFSQATKKEWSSRVYVDLLAGPGRCHLENKPSERFDGSPLLACKVPAPFQRILLIEGDARMASALKQRVASIPQAKVLVADCNSQAAINQARDVLEGSLGLVFADALGIDTIHLETIRTLASRARFDLIYAFHHQDANRNLKAALASESERARFAAGLGTDWGDAWLAHSRRISDTINVGDALEQFFCRQLQLMNYEHVEPLQAVTKNSKNAALYRLLLAAHDPLAAKLWKGISAIEADGQRTLGLD